MKSRNTESSSPELACQYALRLLTARDYTGLRLRKKLRDHNFDELHIEAAISRLIAEGWLNDRRFAERFAESALSSGRSCGARLQQEMLRRGIPADMTHEVLSCLNEEFDEQGEIHRQVERRFGGFSFAAASDREKRRVVGFLQRRGFGLSAIFRALRLAEQ